MDMNLDVPYFKQNRDFTCGPACLRMVLAYYGVEQDEVSLTMLCGTTLAGTGLAEIAEAAQRLGFETEWKTNAKFDDLRNSLKAGAPVMAMVDARFLRDMKSPLPLGHLVIIIALAKDKIIYHDREIGAYQKISLSKFTSAWEQMRKGMVIIWQRNKIKA